MIQTRLCQQCGRTFQGGPRAYYCPSCRETRRKIRDREHKRKGSARPLGSVDKCELCGGEYIVMGGLQRFCPQCKPLHSAEYDRKTSLQFYNQHKYRINPIRNKKRQKKPINCAWCRKLFKPYTRSKACSPECRRELKNKWWRRMYRARKKYKYCVICGIRIVNDKVHGYHRIRTCSHKCYKEYCKLNLTGNYNPRNEKSQISTVIASSKAWEIKSPEGVIYRPYDLAEWARKNIHLLPGSPKQAKTAFSVIKNGKIRSWHDWTLIDCRKPDDNIKICRTCSEWYIDAHVCRY